MDCHCFYGYYNLYPFAIVIFFGSLFPWLDFVLFKGRNDILLIFKNKHLEYAFNRCVNKPVMTSMQMNDYNVV